MTPDDDDAGARDWRAIWRNPLARDYVFVGMIALIVVFVGMTVRGGMIPGLLAPAVGAMGLVFRLPGMPVIFLLLFSYLLIFPFGVPVMSYGFADMNASQFRITDVILVGAAAVYFGCQYRLLSLTHRAVPSDRADDRTKHPPIRPEETATEQELPRMIWTILAVVFVGQIAWFILTSFTLDLARFPPLRDLPSANLLRGNDRPYGLSIPLARMLMAFGVLLFSVIVARLIFWHWRLSRLTQEQARMVLLDVEWTENRRELNRQEKWRASRRPGGVFTKPAPKKVKQNWGPLRLAIILIVAIAVFLVFFSRIR